MSRQTVAAFSRKRAKATLAVLEPERQNMGVTRFKEGNIIYGERKMLASFPRLCHWRDIRPEIMNMMR